MKRYLLVPVAALALMAAPAMARDVNKALILPGIASGGLQGGIGCLYIPTDFTLDPRAPDGVFTMPFDASPNTAQILAGVNIMNHHTMSFDLGAPSGACKDAPKAPTIEHPQTF